MGILKTFLVPVCIIASMELVMADKVVSNFTEFDTSGYADVEDTLETDEYLSVLFPGTKWCGAGNSAGSYEDLGRAKGTDMCCRDHDHCTDLILSGESKYGLTNDASYTRLSCECDEKFRACLHDVKSKIANKVGQLYFNVIGTKCYRKYYPIIGCNVYGGFFKRKCIAYNFDTNAEMIYQWFDVSNY